MISNHAGLLRLHREAAEMVGRNAIDFADILLTEILLIIKLGDSYEQISTQLLIMTSLKI